MGLPLAQAQNWVARRGEDLPARDLDFIEHSTRADTDRRETAKALEIRRIRAEEEVQRLLAEKEAREQREQADAERRRRRRVVKIASVAVLFIAALAGFAALQWVEADAQRNQAEAQRLVAERQQRIAQEELSSSYDSIGDRQAILETTAVMFWSHPRSCARGLPGCSWGLTTRGLPAKRANLPPEQCVKHEPALCHARPRPDHNSG
jgi:hypothetical protein